VAVGDWIRWPGWICGVIYFVLLSLAPFGIGALGRRLSEAARIDGTGWAGGIEVTACSWRGPTGFVPKRIREKHD
jgi:hypothetical protein